MFYTLKTIFILIRLAEIVTCEPAAFSVHDFMPVGIHGAEIACKKVIISNDIAVSAIIRVTPHGNGYLNVANLTSADLSVYRYNYRNILLTIKFADFDGDGYRDLVIYGIEDFYGEKDDNHEKIRGSRLVIRIYRFTPERRQFEPFFIYAPTDRPIYD